MSQMPMKREDVDRCHLCINGWANRSTGVLSCTSENSWSDFLGWETTQPLHRFCEEELKS